MRRVEHSVNHAAEMQSDKRTGFADLDQRVGCSFRCVKDGVEMIHVRNEGANGSHIMYVR